MWHMIVEIEQSDIAALLKDREYTFSLPAGAVRMHSAAYVDGHFEFYVDYPSKANARCVVTQCALNGNTLSARLNFPESRLTSVLLRLLTGIIPQTFSGIELRYPDITVDISRFPLPFVPGTLECLPASLRITGEYRPCGEELS